MMVIGRALMAKPKLLLLDEPSLGIAPKLVQDIARSIVAINRDEGVSVLAGRAKFTHGAEHFASGLRNGDRECCDRREFERAVAR